MWEDKSNPFSKRAPFLKRKNNLTKCTFSQKKMLVLQGIVHREKMGAKFNFAICCYTAMNAIQIKLFAVFIQKRFVCLKEKCIKNKFL